MVIEDFPHSAVIKWKAEGTKDPTTGVFTPGGETEIPLDCNIQPKSSGNYIISPDGDSIKYNWHIFADPHGSIPNNETVPDNATITFFGKDRKIIQLFVYQTHIEIYV